MRGIWLTSVLVLLGGCVVPPVIQVVSLVGQGFSYANTGKGVADHGISMVAEKDCALHRVVKGEKLCREDEGDGTATAFAPAGEEEDLADDATAESYTPAADGLPPYGPTEATVTAFAPSGEEENLADDASADADGLAADGLPPYGPTGAPATVGAGQVGEATRAAVHVAAWYQRPM